jgi:seryl-tRNA synthetase
MLNSTLIATERAMCCVVENHQTPTGIKVRRAARSSAQASAPLHRLLLAAQVPEVLQEYMGGITFMPFVQNPPKPKKGPAPVQHVPTDAERAEQDAGRQDLQNYMDGILPQLNAALNTLARDRPEQPLQALAALLTKGAASTPADAGS